MKALRDLLKKQIIQKKITVSSKDVFFVFQKVIKEEFGNVGANNFTARHFSNKTIFIQTESSNWASELWLNKKKIIEKINKELGENEVGDIKINS